ncbi:MAG: transporter substrate-binding protein [Clostridiaceae bacterium]|nr:transporter substrate-binding protein [Clostridiaceae bacterium]
MSRRKIKVVIYCITFTMMFFVLATGCESQSNKVNIPNNEKSGGKQITVLVEAGSPAFSVAKNTAEEFKRETGYDVKIESAQYIDVFNKLRAAEASESGAYDVATIDVLWLPNLAKGLLPIDEIVTNEVKDDLLPEALKGGKYNERFYGLPAWTDCKILFYRKDLFENPKEKETFKNIYGYDLNPPKNWKEYRDIAKFFTRDTNKDGKIDIYGTSVFGANDGDSVCSWLDHSLQAGAKPVVVDEKGEVLINKKPYVEALQFLSDILNKDKSAPPRATEMSSAETAEMFWNGKLAMMLAWGHFYVPSNDPQKSSVAGKVGTSAMIAGDAGVGSIPGPWYQVIPSSSKNKEIAKRYLMFLYGKNFLYMDAFGVASRKSVFDEYSKKAGYEHLKSVYDSLSGVQSQNRPALAEWPQIESEVLAPAIQQALIRKKSPKEALDGAAEQLKAMLQKNDF